jgi:cleavage and polyadenylation specificity factor subunit 1
MVLCNLDLGLAQILPMLDEETGAEPRIVKASLADPFLLLIRDDASIFLAQCDDDNDLEEIEKDDEVLVTAKWLTGCLYRDTTGSFTCIQRDTRLNDAGPVYMFLFNAEGALYVCICKHETSVDIDASSGICIAGSWKSCVCGRRSFFYPPNDITSVYSTEIGC